MNGGSLNMDEAQLEANREEALDKFYRALEKFHLTHDPETGRLSEPMIIVAYDRRKRVEVSRIMIFKKYFLIIRDEEWDTQRMMYENVKGFRPYSFTIE